MAWLFLACAIAVELGAVLALRLATAGRRPWYAAVAGGYLLAFAFLALALDRGMGIGLAYGTWAAAGIALTAIAGKVLFGDPLDRRTVLGIACIFTGVLLVELGTAH